MVTQDKNIYYLNESGFGDFRKMSNKLNDLKKRCDIVITFSSNLEFESKQDIHNFSREIKNKKILLYEEETGKGCVVEGWSSVVVSLVSTVLTNIILAVPVGFLEELGKNIYKKSLAKLFKKHGLNKYNIGNIIFEVSLDNLRLNYIFFDYFSEEDSFKAFNKIKSHLIDLDKNVIQGDFSRFVYDRKEEKWMIIN